MMRQITGLLSILTLLLWCPSLIADQRTFVSAGTGSDANPCTRALPCRNFAAAILATDANGEVIALDSGGYGPVVVSGPVSIVSPPGVYAGITAFAGTAIEIDAGTTSAVLLRGLTLTGLGGEFGIEAISLKKLFVQNCVISGFWNDGLRVGESFSESADVFITDTVARLNGSATFGAGFKFYHSRANLERVSVESNYTGIEARVEGKVTVTRSTVSGNEVGLNPFGTNGVINVESCTVSNNLYGFYTSATARVANTMITNNGLGVYSQLLGENISFGNNRLHGNGTNGTFDTTIPTE